MLKNYSTDSLECSRPAIVMQLLPHLSQRPYPISEDTVGAGVADIDVQIKVSSGYFTLSALPGFSCKSRQ